MLLPVGKGGRPIMHQAQVVVGNTQAIDLTASILLEIVLGPLKTAITHIRPKPKML